jgi:hypothetical protein
MPTPTYTALATVTLGTTAATVTFSSIPATYRDLILVVNASSSVQTELFLRFNGDTGSNYNTVRMQGSGSVAASASTSNATGARLNGNGDIMTTLSFNAVIQLMDYSATDKHKSALSRTSSASGIDACAVRWANTNAITTILAYPTTGTFSSGSTFNLFGVIS